MIGKSNKKIVAFRIFNAVFFRFSQFEITRWRMMAKLLLFTPKVVSPAEMMKILKGQKD